MSPLIVASLLLAQAAAPLTLDDALKQARARNQDIKVASARLEQAHTMSKKIWSNYLPQITAGGSYTYNNVEANISLPTGYAIRQVCAPDGSDQGCTMPDASGAGGAPALPLYGKPTPYFMQPTGFVTAPIQKHHQVGGQLSVSQAIFAPALLPAIAESYLMEEFAELNVETAKREILFAVAQLYYGAVGAQEATKVQEQLLAANVAHEKDAQVKVDAGVAPRIVLLRAQIDRTKSEADVRRARLAYDGTRSALSMLLDRDADFDVVMPEEPPVPPQFDKVVERTSERPDVKAAEKGYELARHAKDWQALWYLPNVGLQAALRGSNVTGFTGANATWFVTIGLNWTLWDGGLREANLKETAARVSESEAGMRTTQLKAQDELRRAILDFESAKANKLKAEETVKLAREGRQLVEVGFKAGTSTYVEVSDANAALAGAEMGRIGETLNAQLSVLKLAKAAGAFNPQ